MKQSKGKEPFIIDVITAIKTLDKYKKGTSEYEKAHKEAVKQVEKYNAYFGHGEFSVSISKVRHLIQTRDSDKKSKLKLVAERPIPKKKKKDEVIKKGID